MSESNPASRPNVASPRLPRFLDAEGRLKQWPTRRRDQLAALERLAGLFEPGRRYTEREVNELLQSHHTFGDWALLRRELFDFRFVDRLRDGSSYWRRIEPGEAAT